MLGSQTHVVYGLYKRPSRSDMIQSHVIRIQKDIEILKNWEKLWNMSFNPSKCRVIHVTQRKMSLYTKYHLHDCVFERVPSAKYLGVTISEDLKWSGQHHKDKIRKRAKIRNRYNQAPHLTLGINGKVTASQFDITRESEAVSPFPAGGHKASIDRRAQKHNKTK